MKSIHHCELLLRRVVFGSNFTIGALYINGHFLCDTLEDEVRDLPNEPKIMHETAIPAGTYKIEITYSQRFGRLLPILLNVPYFSGVRIHGGNTIAHTSGCPLVGVRTPFGTLEYSQKTLERLMFQLSMFSTYEITIE